MNTHFGRITSIYCNKYVWIYSSLMESNKNLTMLDIEKSVSSNLCRCTGYRPILDSLKKFAVDAPKEDRIMDIKDLSICKTSGNCCQSSNNSKEDGWCMVGQEDWVDEKMMKIELKDGKIWYRPMTLSDVQKVLKENAGSDYMLVAGNTSKGNLYLQKKNKDSTKSYELFWT